MINLELIGAFFTGAASVGIWWALAAKSTPRPAMPDAYQRMLAEYKAIVAGTTACGKEGPLIPRLCGLSRGHNGKCSFMVLHDHDPLPGASAVLDDREDTSDHGMDADGDES